MRSLEDQGFLFILVAISLAFALVIWPYYEAVVWGVVTAVVFAPLYRRLRNALPRRRNLAALTTVLIIVAMVILPLMVIASSLLQEMLTLYDSFKLDELDFARYFQRVLGISPNWAVGLLDQFGLTNFTAVQERLAALERSAKPCLPRPQCRPEDVRLRHQLGHYAVLAVFSSARWRDACRTGQAGDTAAR